MLESNWWSCKCANTQNNLFRSIFHCLFAPPLRTIRLGKYRMMLADGKEWKLWNSNWCLCSAFVHNTKFNATIHFPKALHISNLFCLTTRLQWRNIQSPNIRRGTEIWWNSDRNLHAVFKVVRSMGDYCVWFERHCMASDENLYGRLVARLDRCRWSAPFQWSAWTNHETHTLSILPDRKLHKFCFFVYLFRLRIILAFTHCCQSFAYYSQWYRLPPGSMRAARRDVICTNGFWIRSVRNRCISFR